MSERAVFVVDPLVMISRLLPPGNAITGLTVTDDGLLVFEFQGVDVPREELGVQRMTLMGASDAKGVVEHWFEPTPETTPNASLTAILAPLFNPPTDG